MKRITVIMSDETYNKIIVLGKQEKRKKSPMALLLIEDGLKLTEKIILGGDVIDNAGFRHRKLGL